MVIWNVRGINNPIKQKALVDRIRKLNANFICLVETRVKKEKSTDVVRKCFPDWSMIYNYDKAINGRIWILWRHPVVFDSIVVHEQFISGRINMQGKFFYFTGVYGME